MKILIIECGAHEQIINYFYEIFNDFSDEITILGKQQRKSWFPKEIHSKANLVLSKPQDFWLKAAELSKTKEHIIFFTPPEYSGTNSKKFMIGFLWYVLRHRNKITLLIRNTNLWLLEKNKKPSLNNLIRFCTHKVLRNRKAFEYSQISKNLITENEKFAVLPISYWNDNKIQFKEKLNICFSGRVNYEIRDLETFFMALNYLDTDTLATISFYVSSPMNHKEQAKLLNDLNNVANIFFNQNWDQYLNIIKTSHLMFAPLVNNKKYGITKGTGSFGDALYTNRKVIIPRFVCEDNEFDGVAYYYQSAEELAEIFRLAVINYRQNNANFFTIDQIARQSFSKENIYSNFLMFVQGK